MYSCALWSGSSLPLPKINAGNLVRENNWNIVFTSKDDIPLFWWFLLEERSFFWLADGTPIFIVGRIKALENSAERYSEVEDLLSPEQRQAWIEFHERVRRCRGGVFNIQLPHLWNSRFLANAERFNVYINHFLLPLKSSTSKIVQQLEPKRLAIAAHLKQLGTAPQALSGDQPALE